MTYFPNKRVSNQWRVTHSLGESQDRLSKLLRIRVIAEALGEYKLPPSSRIKCKGQYKKVRITYEIRNRLKQISRGSFKSKEFLRNNPLWFFISNYNFQVRIQTLKTASGGGEQQRDAAGDIDVLRSLEEGLARSKGLCRML